MPRRGKASHPDLPRDFVLLISTLLLNSLVLNESKKIPFSGHAQYSFLTLPQVSFRGHEPPLGVPRGRSGARLRGASRGFCLGSGRYPEAQVTALRGPPRRVSLPARHRPHTASSAGQYWPYSQSVEALVDYPPDTHAPAYTALPKLRLVRHICGA